MKHTKAFVETGKTELAARVPHLFPEVAQLLARELQSALEQSSSWKIDEFTISQTVEQIESGPEEVSPKK